jgi:site-specific DNA recombinase
MLNAGKAVYSELKNLCIWTKDNGGLGSFYRSQHELVFVFKVGTAALHLSWRVTRGPLAHLLRNRFYVGEVVFKGETLPGEQRPIVDRALFNAVQARLDAQLRSHKQRRETSGALLAGRLYDDRGQRMTPSHTRKRSRKYRYYISSALCRARPNRPAASIVCRRTRSKRSAIKSVRDHVGLPADLKNRAVVADHVSRVVIHADRLSIGLSNGKTGARATQRLKQLEIPWRKLPAKRHREILLPDNAPSQPTRPIRAENRALLVASIAKGRRWLDEVIGSPAIGVEDIAKREHCTARKVNMTISLAFLAPDLVKAAIEGLLPYGMGVTRLSDMPAEWSNQYRALGLSP